MIWHGNVILMLDYEYRFYLNTPSIPNYTLSVRVLLIHMYYLVRMLQCQYKRFVESRLPEAFHLEELTWKLECSKGSLLVLIYRSTSHPWVSNTFHFPLSGQDLQRPVTISFEVLPYVGTTLGYSDG